MLRPDTFALTALLGMLGALMPLTMDIYLSSLPDVARTLGATSGEVLLTISTYLIGAAVGTITYGPIADRFGRRPVLISALVVFCTGCAVCALAPSIEVLLLGRALQALGPSGAVVLMRAIVRDLYDGVRMSRQLAVISTLTAIGPLVAAPLGGFLQTVFGWRSIFVVLFALSALLLATVAMKLPETLAIRTESLSLRMTLRIFARMLRNRAYAAYVGIMTVTGLGMVSWLSIAPFVLQNFYGLSPLLFGVAFVVATSGFVIGSAMASRMVTRFGIDRCIGIGAAMLAGAGLTMTGAVAAGIVPGFALVLSMTVFMTGVGFVFPQSLAGALSKFREGAGAASSLAGFMQQATGALFATIVGRTLDATPLILAILMATAGCLSLLVWFATRRIRAGG